MQNFEIEGTGDNLQEQVQRASLDQNKEEDKSYKQQNLPTIHDQFDLINCGIQCGFKIISITLYLILKLLTDSYLATFVVTVLLVTFDFWTTKNLTARKLVGLRWWSQLTQNGQEEWIFQSRSLNRVPNTFNVGIFWISQLVSLAFWAIIGIINLFTISIFWIGLALFCQLLTIINFVCFFKCRGQHQKQAQDIKEKLGIRQI